MTEEALPAWRRRTSGETRWPAMGVVVATLVLQVALPADMVLHPRWLLPAVSALLVVALLLANPGRMTHFSTVERVISLLLVAAVTAVNAFSAVSLVLAIAGG
ncbi:hypothetical protein ABT262_49270, partial [Amycolatopsis mediterranei]